MLFRSPVEAVRESIRRVGLPRFAGLCRQGVGLKEELLRTPGRGGDRTAPNAQDDRRVRSEEHTSELQSLAYFVCRLLLEKKKKQLKSRWIAASTARSLWMDPGAGRHGQSVRSREAR